MVKVTFIVACFVTLPWLGPNLVELIDVGGGGVGGAGGGLVVLGGVVHGGNLTELKCDFVRNITY